MAGMPVEVFIKTSPRTVVSYLTKPLREQVDRAFRGR
jgi:HlyD family secretion protein